MDFSYDLQLVQYSQVNGIDWTNHVIHSIFSQWVRNRVIVFFTLLIGDNVEFSVAASYNDSSKVPHPQNFLSSPVVSTEDD